MATIKKGTYRFNDVLAFNQYWNPQTVNFTSNNNSYFGFFLIAPAKNEYCLCYCDDVSTGSGKPAYGTTTSGGIPLGWNTSAVSQTITITEDQDVTDDFYTWFTANAKEQKVIKAGTYRFNDVLTNAYDLPEFNSWHINIPFHIDVTTDSYGTHRAYCDQMYFYFNDDAGNEFVEASFNIVSCDILEQLGYALPSSTFVYVEGSWKTEYGKGIQTITIPNDTAVSAEFAEWFNENAVEQKQISGVWRVGAPMITKDFTWPDIEIVQDVAFTVPSVGINLLEPATYRCVRFTITSNGLGIWATSIESILPGESVFFEEPEEVLSYFEIGSNTGVVDFGVAPQPVSVQFYEWFTRIAQPDPYKTIKAGRYRIKDEISAFPLEGVSIEPLEFYCSGFSTGNDILYTAYCSGFVLLSSTEDLASPALAYVVFKTTPDYPEKVPMAVVTHESGVTWPWLVYDDPQLITIPKDAQVSSSFYEWFTANSNALESRQISGVWKLNEQITFPQNYIREFVHFSIDIARNNTTYTSLYSAAVIDATNEELSGYQYACMPEIAGFNQGGGIGYRDGSWLWDAWGDAVNVLDFGVEPQYVSVEFYDWLITNTMQPTTLITYNGATSATIFGSKNIPLGCNGKKMQSDIVVTFGNAGSITYNETQTSVESGKTKKLHCSGKVMESDVVIEVPQGISRFETLYIKTIPDKVVYLLGEELSLEGGVIALKYADGSTKEIPMVSAHYVTNFDNTVPGSYYIEFEYVEHGHLDSAAYYVAVKEPPTPTPILQRIWLETLPKTEYKVGEWLSTKDGILIVEYTDGTYDVHNLNNTDVFGFAHGDDPETWVTNAPGTYELEIRYRHGGITKTCTYTITVTE